MAEQFEKVDVKSLRLHENAAQKRSEFSMAVESLGVGEAFVTTEEIAKSYNSRFHIWGAQKRLGRIYTVRKLKDGRYAVIRAT